MTRTRRLLGALAALLLVLGAGSAARADTRSSPVLAAITLPAGGSALDEVTVGTAVWTLSVDGNHGYLFRIDPASNAVTAEIDLPSGSPTGDAFYQGGLVYAFGSLWVPETYRDQVWRIDPVARRVQARISTGRYPALLTAGGGSVWVSQGEAGSVARIDPRTDAVVATIPVGRQAGGKDQPSGVNFDPYTNAVLVDLPATHRIASIAATTQAVSTFSVAPAFACGRAVPLPDGFWLDDTPCSNDLFRWDSATHQVVAHITPDPPDGGVLGIAVRNDVLYSGEGVCGATSCYGAVVKRDVRTGAVIRRVRTPSFLAFLPDLAGGDLWVAGYFDGILVHLRAF